MGSARSIEFNVLDMGDYVMRPVVKVSVEGIVDFDNWDDDLDYSDPMNLLWDQADCVGLDEFIRDEVKDKRLFILGVTMECCELEKLLCQCKEVAEKSVGGRELALVRTKIDEAILWCEAHNKVVRTAACGTESVSCDGNAAA